MKKFGSLLGHNLIDIKKIIKESSGYLDGYHLDMIDNHFAPNLGLGTDTINSILNFTDKICYIHLMLDNSTNIISMLKVKNNTIIALHQESFDNKGKLLETATIIKNKNAKVAIAVKVNTDFDSYKDIIKYFDNILILTVKPGFSGSDFISDGYTQIKKVNDYLITNKLNTKIDLDGGIKKDVLEKLEDVKINSITSSSFQFLKNI